MNLHIPSNRAILRSERRWLAVPKKYKRACNPRAYLLARRMRRKGFLLKRIAYELKISKWTATQWCKGVKKASQSVNPDLSQM